MFLEAVGDTDWWTAFLKDRPVIYRNFTFQKQSSLSQYRIIGPNGPQLLSVPTVRSTRRNLIEEVEVSNTEDWQGQHWKGIRTAYRGTPFYMYYAHFFEPLYKKQYTHLWTFQKEMFLQICKALRIDDALEFSDQAVNYEEREVMEGKPYPQVFDERHGYVGDLCILDVLFNLGPETLDWLEA